MHAHTLLPDAKHLKCDSIRWDGTQVTIEVSSSAPTSICPSCGCCSGRIHSHYRRRLQDLPWQGTTVRIHWHSRRIFCDRPACPQRIFTERLPEVAAPHARKTERFVTALRALALSCGGEAGARLARRLEMPTSPDTLLREARRTSWKTSTPVAQWVSTTGHCAAGNVTVRFSSIWSGIGRSTSCRNDPPNRSEIGYRRTQRLRS